MGRRRGKAVQAAQGPSERPGGRLRGRLETKQTRCVGAEDASGVAGATGDRVRRGKARGAAQGPWRDHFELAREWVRRGSGAGSRGVPWHGFCPDTPRVGWTKYNRDYSFLCKAW